MLTICRYTQYSHKHTQTPPQSMAQLRKYLLTCNALFSILHYYYYAIRSYSICFRYIVKMRGGACSFFRSNHMKDILLEMFSKLNSIALLFPFYSVSRLVNNPVKRCKKHFLLSNIHFCDEISFRCLPNNSIQLRLVLYLMLFLIFILKSID